MLGARFMAILAVGITWILLFVRRGGKGGDRLRLFLSFTSENTRRVHRWRARLQERGVPAGMVCQVGGFQFRMRRLRRAFRDYVPDSGVELHRGPRAVLSVSSRILFAPDLFSTRRFAALGFRHLRGQRSDSLCTTPLNRSLVIHSFGPARRWRSARCWP